MPNEIASGIPNKAAQRVFGESVLAIKDALRGRKRKQNESLIVSLTDSTSGLPLYLVPGLDFHPTDFTQLALNLPNQRLLIFNIPGEEAGTDFTKSIGSIAQRYAEAINQFQPGGPLAIGGSCVGSIIALELARQLEARGRDVRFLSVFDYGPVAMTRTWENLFKNAALSLTRSFIKPSQRLVTAKALWAQTSNSLESSKLPKLSRLSKFPGVLLREYLEGGKETDKSGKPKKPPYEVIPNDLPPRLINLGNYPQQLQARMVDLFNSGEQYKAESYPNPVVAYVAEGETGAYKRWVKTVWRRVARDLEIVAFGGDHPGGQNSFLNNPRLAEHLESKLNKFGSNHYTITRRPAHRYWWSTKRVQNLKPG